MKVKCVYTEVGELTVGDSYQVRGNAGLRLRIENDAGDTRYYPAHWFEVE